MNKVRGWPVLALSLSVAPVSAQQTPAPEPPANTVNSDAKLMADFRSKVDAYVKLRDTLEKGSLPLENTSDPAEITASERALAQKIRTARATAAQGDFFPPATAALLKRLLAPAVRGVQGAGNSNAIQDDNPLRVRFKVNGDYPKQQTISTVPPDVLEALPALPDNVQYRFVSKHLILYDVRSNTIMDYMTNALP